MTPNIFSSINDLLRKRKKSTIAKMAFSSKIEPKIDSLSEIIPFSVLMQHQIGRLTVIKRMAPDKNNLAPENGLPKFYI